MTDFGLLALDRSAWAEVGRDPAEFARERLLELQVDSELLRAVGQQTVAMLDRTGASAPWTGYLGVDRARQIIIGTCAFPAQPDADGIVEIAYFTFPPHEGRGYASRMAAELVKLAQGHGGVRRLRAHTLPERNASTRILDKLGFVQTGEALDPEAGRVWRWELACEPNPRYP